MKPLHLLKRLSLTGLSLLVSLFIVEGTFRTFEIEPSIRDHTLDPENAEILCTKPSTLRGYMPIPGTCGRNSLGVVGPELDALDPDKARVLVLGDSVSVQQGWIHIAYETLPELHLFNSSLSGYETCQQLDVLNELLPKIQPDWVLLQMTPNDIGGSPVLIPLEDGRARYFLATEAFDFPAWVLAFKSITYVTLRVGAARSARKMRSNDEAERYTRRCLEEIQSSVRSDQLLAVLFPSPLPLHNTERTAWESELKIAAMLQELGISHLYLREAFESGGDIRRLQQHSNDNIHPNAQGHGLAAVEIEGFIRRHKLQKD